MPPLLLAAETIILLEDRRLSFQNIRLASSIYEKIEIRNWTLVEATVFCEILAGEVIVWTCSVT